MSGISNEIKLTLSDLEARGKQLLDRLRAAQAQLRHIPSTTEKSLRQNKKRIVMRTLISVQSQLKVLEGRIEGKRKLLAEQQERTLREAKTLAEARQILELFPDLVTQSAVNRVKTENRGRPGRAASDKYRLTKIPVGKERFVPCSHPQIVRMAATRVGQRFEMQFSVSTRDVDEGAMVKRIK
jgi:flagellar biosynthesis chaperone FliJ